MSETKSYLQKTSDRAEKRTDNIRTPETLVHDLARFFQSRIDFSEKSIWDPCCGDELIFEKHFEKICKPKEMYSSDINHSDEESVSDFLQSSNTNFDWIICNPPYSKLTPWFEKAANVAGDGVGMLLGWLNLTPNRFMMMSSKGFHLTYMIMLTVPAWPGYNAFLVWQKNPKQNGTQFLVNPKKYFYDQREIDRYKIVTTHLAKGTHAYGAEPKAIKARSNLHSSAVVLTYSDDADDAKNEEEREDRGPSQKRKRTENRSESGGESEIQAVDE